MVKGGRYPEDWGSGGLFLMCIVALCIVCRAVLGVTCLRRGLSPSDCLAVTVREGQWGLCAFLFFLFFLFYYCLMLFSIMSLDVSASFMIVLAQCSWWILPIVGSLSSSCVLVRLFYKATSILYSTSFFFWMHFSFVKYWQIYINFLFLFFWHCIQFIFKCEQFCKTKFICQMFVFSMDKKC